MPEKIRRPLIILLSVGIVALVGWLLFGRPAIFRTTEHPTTYHAKPIELTDGVRVGQSFVPNYPGLYRVDVLLTTFGRRSAPNLVFHLLADGPEGEELFSASLEGEAIADNAFRSFVFPPLDDSAGRRYYFYLESPGATSKEAVGVQASADDRYLEGSIDVKRTEGETRGEEDADLPYKVLLPLVMASNGQEDQSTAHDVGFTLHYKGHLPATAPIFLERLKANKPLFWGETWFYALLSVLYLVLLAWLGRVLARMARNDHKGDGRGQRE